MNPVASRGFNLGAESYEKGRPDYAEEAVRHIVRVLGISSSSTVVDLAAGTGKFTRHLVKTEGRVVAVEPVAGMRCGFLRALPTCDLVGGLAESIPLRDSSVDAVVAAQASHWFDGEKALKEIDRVLRPRGGLGLVWNVRDEYVDWVAEVGEIVNEYWDAGGIPRYWTGGWRRSFDGNALFTTLQSAEFRYVQVASLETMMERFASISYVATLAVGERELFLRRIRKVLTERGVISPDGTVSFPYRVDVFWCYKA